MSGDAPDIDLSLAWKRVKKDFVDGRTFTEHPFEIEIIESGLEKWLKGIESKLEAGYNPGTCRVLKIPKPHGGIRPGAMLDVSDQLVYAGLVQALRCHIQPVLESISPAKDYAYRLKKNHQDANWFDSYFRRWKAFDQDSLSKIKRGANSVVTADIAGYYELIDLQILSSDLRSLIPCADDISLLMKCLNKWSRVQGRGIPQGFSASDILGKLYLNAVDRALFDHGVTHIRWVDDFRLFCKNDAEAREQLAFLIELLSERGLVVQSAKTRIISGSQAASKFHQIHSVLEPIRKSFLDSLIDTGILISPSASTALLDEVLSRGDADEPIEVLKQAFDTHFVESTTEFNKTLLRYLLKRLGSARDAHAFQVALTYLWQYPEETAAVLGYVSAVDQVQATEAYWLKLISEKQIPYDYQIYQFMRWRFRAEAGPSEDYLRWVRKRESHLSQLPVIRSYARATLAKWGSEADLARLQISYSEANSDLEWAEIVRCLVGMEKGRRNAFLGRVKDDGVLTALAAQLTRQEKLPWDAL
jgi:hypothetical protein